MCKVALGVGRITRRCNRPRRASLGSRRLSVKARQNGGHPGGRTAFPTLPTSPWLTAGASFALVVSQGCVPTCPEYMSPCPKPFDVAACCGDTNCQLDMQPAQCAELLGVASRTKALHPDLALRCVAGRLRPEAQSVVGGLLRRRGGAKSSSSSSTASQGPVVAPLRQRSGLHMGTLPGSPYRSRTH